MQFHEFETAWSNNAWRLVAGPAAPAPLIFRAEARVHDQRLGAGRVTALPAAPVQGASRLLYVFAGRVTVSGFTLTQGDSLLLDDAEHRVVVDEDSDLALFTTDSAAAGFDGGMFSGNIVLGQIAVAGCVVPIHRGQRRGEPRPR